MTWGTLTSSAASPAAAIRIGGMGYRGARASSADSSLR